LRIKTCFSFRKAGFVFYLLTVPGKLSARKYVFLLQKEKLKYALYLQTAATSIVQCIRQGQYTDTLDSIYNHPRLPKTSKWKDGDLFSDNPMQAAA